MAGVNIFFISVGIFEDKKQTFTCYVMALQSMSSRIQVVDKGNFRCLVPAKVNDAGFLLIQGQENPC